MDEMLEDLLKIIPLSTSLGRAHFHLSQVDKSLDSRSKDDNDIQY